MFEKKVVLIGLSCFTAMLTIIFTAVYLNGRDILPKVILPFIIPTVMIGSIVTSWILFARYQRRKIFRPHIENELARMGYELISERPLTLGELIANLEFEPTILVGGTPIQNMAHISQNERILHVKNEEDEEYELRSIITKTWKKRYKLEIQEKSRLRYQTTNKG